MESLKNFEDFEAFLASFTNYERQRQFRYTPETLRLERMREFARDVGDPHRGYPAIHVAGSKGKGSTCLMLEALLASDGFRVGTYTSPHVEHLVERIRVSGEPIPAATIIECVNSYLPALQAREESKDALPTFFELMTTIAMSFFSREAVDISIFEVGLGGRLDATNVLTPEITAITNIALEHTGLLGNNIRSIAREKAGIIKEKIPVVLGELSREAESEILSVAGNKNSEVFRYQESSVRGAGEGNLEIEDFSGPVPAPSIRGPALRRNLALALLLHQLVLKTRGRERRRESIAKALSTMVLPARVELFPGPPPVLLDGAHTVESFGALRESLDELSLPGPKTAVFSLSSDKRAKPILQELRGIGNDIIFTRADPIRSSDPESLQAEFGGGEIVEDPRQALLEALRREIPVVVCGSIYLAGEVRGLLTEMECRTRSAEI